MITSTGINLCTDKIAKGTNVSTKQINNDLTNEQTVWGWSPRIFVICDRERC